MGDSQYSFSLTTFSPSGKLVQIEYALNAVAAGATSLGIKATNGVVIATEKKLPTELIDETSVKKIQLLTDNAGVVYSGIGPDSRVLVRKSRKSAQSYYSVYQEVIPVSQLVRETAAVMQEFTQSGGVRPFGVSLLMAGYDSQGPHLYQVDPSGSYFAWKASAIGKNMTNAKTFLEKRYTEDMELEDAIHTAILTLKEGFEGQIAGDNIEIGIVGSDKKFRVLTPAERRTIRTAVQLITRITFGTRVSAMASSRSPLPFLADRFPSLRRNVRPIHSFSAAVRPSPYGESLSICTLAKSTSPLADAPSSTSLHRTPPLSVRALLAINRAVRAWPSNSNSSLSCNHWAGVTCDARGFVTRLDLSQVGTLSGSLPPYALAQLWRLTYLAFLPMQLRSSPTQLRSSPTERASNAAERASNAAERASNAAERASNAAERASNAAERASNAAERASNAAERASNAAERASNAAERASNAAERASNAAERASNAAERASNAAERASNAAERASNAAERASNAAERASNAAERASNAAERASSAAERASSAAAPTGSLRKPLLRPLSPCSCSLLAGTSHTQQSPVPCPTLSPPSPTSLICKPSPSALAVILEAPKKMHLNAPCPTLSPPSSTSLISVPYSVSLSSLSSFMCMARCFGMVLHGAARCGMVHHGTSDLTATQVSGPIPSTFSHLTNLEHLDLAYTSLSGELPSTLSALSKLSYLNIHLQGAPVGGSITTLTFVSRLTRLHTLELFGFDAMTDCFMTALSGLSTLTRLHKLVLGDLGRVVGELPYQLGFLTQLTHLYEITALNPPALLNVHFASLCAAVLLLV
ncbi:unnamed protein product [Closterium sp. Yama58-4]|nr:unnamed protein product [Closterium sp. Yama58-4]